MTSTVTTSRTCGRCGVERDLSMFYLGAEERSRAAGRVRLRPCRLCVRERNAARRMPRQAIIDAVKAESGCADCGLRLPDHPEVFDFDHLPGHEKSRGVALFTVSGSLEDLRAEMAKCEVVCANCHRIRSRRRESPAFGRKR